MSTNIKYRKLAIVNKDPWLEPVQQDIFDRYMRYKNRLSEIEMNYGSLSKFADGYKYFGVNYNSKLKGWYYREWAPKAHQLFLTGDFNNWNKDSHPLKRNDYGVWELFLDEASYKESFVHGSLFKVIVHSDKGEHYRIPAYIKRVVQDEQTKDFSAQLWTPKKYNWEGDKFKLADIKNPLIYECHIGMAQEKDAVGTYKEFQDQILPRIKNAGYNIIQIMAIAEHPYYGSFGYHVSSLFAASSRFGTPEELKDLIKAAHQQGIGVIMDIVHSHTVKNINEGLNEFDGSDDQYFHPGERGEHPSWDSKIFDYGKTEVLQFLLSNIKFWQKEFHFDGYRFDGVGSILYWHHGYDMPFTREKYFNQGVEYDAITYLQLANKLIHTINPKAVSIAEDVSGMPGLCQPIHEGGIGYDYRLAMGIPDYWIKLLKEQPDEQWDIHQLYQTILDRKFDDKTVAYAESHDQALVGDKTIAFRLMDKEMYYNMSVSDQHPVVDRGIALHKMIRLFTIALGGNAYMNFMGNEFGHPEWIDFPREGNNWSYYHARRQWSLLDNPQLKYQYLAKWDRMMLQLAVDFNLLNAPYPQLLNNDDWNKTIVFERGGLLFVFNFHVNLSVMDYEFPIHEAGSYELILNSDGREYGGFGRIDESTKYFSFENKETGVSSLKVYNVNRAVQVFRKQ